MENASKALIMAGAILLAILIISLGVMIFSNMRNSVVNNTSLDEQEIASFNAQITPYMGESISGSQVNALVQLATSINYKAISNEDTIRRVTIYNDTNLLVGISGSTVISNKVTTGKYYKVTGTYDSNGLITNITVE